jgi:hypothetical protein
MRATIGLLRPPGAGGDTADRADTSHAAPGDPVPDGAAPGDPLSDRAAPDRAAYDRASPDGIVPPVPGADRVPRLVERLRETGADISLTIDGDTAALPATTGSAVYRIVQEALTNATRHAPGCAVAVRVAVGGGRVDVAVDSAGTPRPGGGSGLGLVNMRERAQALGGTCTAGPGGSGWLVHAVLPASARLVQTPTDQPAAGHGQGDRA